MTERAILLVDDDSDLREALTEQLALYDEFAITQEESAAAGIKTARENHTDLLIMDVGLPDRSGGFSATGEFDQAVIFCPEPLPRAGQAKRRHLHGLIPAREEFGNTLLLNAWLEISQARGVVERV